MRNGCVASAQGQREDVSGDGARFWCLVMPRRLSTANTRQAAAAVTFLGDQGSAALVLRLVQHRQPWVM